MRSDMNKKICIILFVAMLSIALVACAEKKEDAEMKPQVEENEAAESTEDEEETEGVEDNLLEEFNIEFGPAQSVELLFEGTKESLEQLTYDKVLAILDLSECTEAGTYEVSVSVLECPQGCMYVGGDKVEVIITEK